MTNVKFSMKQMIKVVKKTKGCMVWGGALHLAPADDEMIEVERPLAIDSEGQLIASILAKKLSVSANRILIDLAASSEGKISLKKAKHLKRKMHKLAKAFNVRIKILITDGNQPIGNGIGPSLEARDVLWILKGDPRGPEDLKKKSLQLAAALLSMSKKIKHPEQTAEEILDSGRAYQKCKEIFSAQGMKTINPDEILIGPHSSHVKAKKAGKIKKILNSDIARLAKAAGAPADISAGIYLHKHVGDEVKKNELLFTIYSYSERKMKYAKSLLHEETVTIS